MILPVVTAKSLILPVVTFRSNILTVVTASLANSLAPIPEALTLKASEETSIVLLSTATSKVLPVFVKALPALICPAPENWLNVMSVVPKVGVPLNEVT